MEKPESQHSTPLEDDAVYNSIADNIKFKAFMDWHKEIIAEEQTEANQRELKVVREFAEFAKVSPGSNLALMYLCFRAGMESGTKLGYDLARLEFGNGSPTDSQRGGNA